jgi:two-component system response regulator HydG
MELLMNYDWYGNVRELEHAIERAVVMASGTMITPDDLPAGLRQMEEPLDDSNEEPVRTSITLYEYEKRYILQTLKAVKWNKYQAAKRLGITRSTLYSKIEKYQLKPGKG